MIKSCTIKKIVVILQCQKTTNNNNLKILKIMESSYLPLGAENDARAPYNQPKAEQIEVEAFESLTRKATLDQDDYLMETFEHDYCMPSELLERMADLLEKIKTNCEIDPATLRQINYYQSECQAWKSEDKDIYEC